MTTRYPLVLNGTSIQELQNSDSLILPSALSISSGGTGLTSFTSGGVVYASSTSALATGSALTFDGTNLLVGNASVANGRMRYQNATNDVYGEISTVGGADFRIESTYGSTAGYKPITFYTNGSEQMRLNSTGLGIGTSSPSTKLTVYDATTPQVTFNNGTSTFIVGNNSGGNNHILYGTGAYPMIFYTNATEAMRIDNAGNLGLGVTPSAWSSTLKPMEIGNIGTYIAGRPSGNQIDIGVNNYYNAGFKYANTGVAATLYEQTGGSHAWSYAASGTAGNAITFTQAMTLDASGRLIVGATSAYGSGPIQGFSASASNFSTSQFSAIDTTTSTTGVGGQIGFYGRYNSASADSAFFGAIQGIKENSTNDNTACALTFYTRPTATVPSEKMRLDSAGNLGLGVTPSAWNSSLIAMQFSARGAIYYDSGYYGEVGLVNNGYWAAGSANNWRYTQSSGTAALYKQNQGVHSWSSAPSGTAGNAITFTQAMTLDASGNLGIGTSSPGAKLDVNGNALIYGLTVGRGAGAVSTNTAVGASALSGGSQSGSYNTVVGYQALLVNTTGAGNSAFGYGALSSNTTGGTNFAGGLNAMLANTTGSNNLAIGRDALGANTTASNNTAVGYQAGYSNTTGTITALGYLAGYGQTTGTLNTFLGQEQGSFNTVTGVSNSGVGYRALLKISSGSYNTAIGQEALRETTSASNNTAVGYQAGYTNTTGTSLVAMGKTALYNNTTGSYNTAIGGPDAGNQSTMGTNSTGSYNTALGSGALSLSTTASNNTAVGYQAGYSNTTGTYQTFVGYTAGHETTGTNSTFVGQGAGYFVTTGAKNTILGQYNGNQSGLDIRTSSNYIVLSDGDGNPRGVCDNNGAWNLNRMSGINVTQTSTSGTTSIIDTGIYFNTSVSGYSGYSVYEMYLTGNPNAGGSTYHSVVVGLIIVVTGYTYAIPGVIQEIRYVEQANQTGSNNGAFTVTLKFWNGSTESDYVSDGTTNAQIRIKVTGYNPSYTGVGQLVYLTKRI